MFESFGQSLSAAPVDRMEVLHVEAGVGRRTTRHVHGRREQVRAGVVTEEQQPSTIGIL
jgi:hypothetical protein